MLFAQFYYFMLLFLRNKEKTIFRRPLLELLLNSIKFMLTLVTINIILLQLARAQRTYYI